MLQKILENSVTRLIVCLIVLILPGEPLWAALQQEEGEYARRFREARELSGRADFESSIRILDELLRATDISPALKRSAYELLGQNYLAKSYIVEAQTAIKKLLELFPSYVAPAYNPPFAAEVERVRREMVTKMTVEPMKKTEEPAKKAEPLKTTEPLKKEELKEEETSWYENTLVLVAGGVVVAGGAAWLIFHKPPPPPPPPGETALPEPPNLP